MINYLSQEKHRLEKKIKFLTYFHNDGNGNIAAIVNNHFNGDKELLSMDIDSLTVDNLEKLEDRLNLKIIPRLERYSNLSPTQLWDDDLQNFITLWEEYQNQDFDDDKLQELRDDIRERESQNSDKKKSKRSLEQCSGHSSDQLIPDSKKYKH